MLRLLPVVSLATVVFAPNFLAAQDKTSAARVEFNRDIRPILSDNCFLCHGPAKATRKADLRLDTEAGAFADLGGYRAIVPGKPNDSHLWLRLTASDESKRMPPPKTGRRLTAQQIDVVRRWIEQGANWQNHWAFIAPKSPPLPTVKRSDWVRNPIDRFILARLEREQLPPASEASRETLIRRVTFDLTGLPPTLKEVDDFLADHSPNAYEKIVDRLLASPRYGERMVLDWLDAARYSDSNGYQTDGTRAMWPWRDWVIDAFNKNMPFDQFTIEQLAGDMLPGATLNQKIATGFNRNHMLNGEGGRIAEESRVDYVVDRVDTTFTVWQGLTAGCARCHDHKYDPLSQKEYYQLYAYYNNVNETGGVDRRSSTAAPVIELPTPEQKIKHAEQTKRVAELDKKARALDDKLLAALPAWESKAKSEKLPANVLAALAIEPKKRKADEAKAVTEQFLVTFPERKAMQKELDAARKALEALNKSILITMIMEEKSQPRDTFVLIRGAYDKYGAKVGPGVPAVLPPLPKDAPNNRLGFARWLVDRANPLTARVIVNRYWQMIFGTGLVKTSEDFGVQGEPPSHPELLDWLAVEFMEPAEPSAKAWDLKRLLRLTVTSATYRQSSRVSPAALEKDPGNRLLSRGPRFRLTPFELRDQALALSGLLVDRTGGPPTKPYQPPGLWEDFSFQRIKYVQDHGENLYRRSLYTFWRRSIAPPNMFDTSPRQVCTVRTARTNTPLHALVLLNDVTFVEAARVWAQRLLKEPGKSPNELIDAGFRAATARRPTEAEHRVLTAALSRSLSHYERHRDAAEKLITTGEHPRDPALDVTQLAAWTAVMNMILNLDEAICKE